MEETRKSQTGVVANRALYKPVHGYLRHVTWQQYCDVTITLVSPNFHRYINGNMDKKEQNRYDFIEYVRL